MSRQFYETEASVIVVNGRVLKEATAPPPVVESKCPVCDEFVEVGYYHRSCYREDTGPPKLSFDGIDEAQLV